MTLDHADRRIAVLELSQRVLQDVCARRMELLKRVAGSMIAIDEGNQFVVRAYILRIIWDAIKRETDENEVQS